MSGPFRFNQEEAKSPLDRSASPSQPVSFKTNVNRMKTKKWVQAKKNAYDGDDWGEYDEYDEYGVNPDPQEPEPPSAQRYYAQRGEQPSRSFTDPSQQAPLPKVRRNSFEHGEEQRAFSSSTPYQQQGYAQQYGEPQQQGSGAEYGAPSDRDQARDFSPSAMPQPLQTRAPPNLITSSTTVHPPRKSSVGQAESPIAFSPRTRTDSQPEKPLAFIRPADIYKRVEEERVRERASLDSSRPSLDSLSSRPRDGPASPQAEGAKSLFPLEPVAERKSEYLSDYDAPLQGNSKQPPHPASSQQEPSFQPAGAFNNSLWSSVPQLHPAPVVSPPDDQGFRPLVNQAFTRSDDQRSIPPTPIAKESDSEMSRSNTGSTSGISPIMSRVPSSATSALKNRNQTGAEGSTPAIAEEPSETVTPVSQPTTAIVPDVTQHIARKPSPGHSRNFSGSSIPRSGFATPTHGDSPARSPVIAPQNNLPEPEAALFATTSLETPTAMEGGLKGPSPAYASREADLATAINNGPVGAAPGLSAAERQSQNTFLESHATSLPIEAALPRDRSESPNKGRVQALAGKFGDVSHSRRGSTQSNASRNSVQSWERSHDNSRSASPTKANPGKSSPTKEFRPHLPGQWESYATTAGAVTPWEQNEHGRELGLGRSNSSEIDLTPTTAKRPVAELGSSSPSTSDPIAALKDAGAAMVQSIRATVGLNDTTSESEQARKGHGNVYMPRPLQLDRTVSSISSAPPTPPAKDTPEIEYPPPPPLKENPPKLFMKPQRPNLDSQLSTEPSNEDQESDRLRKEIVASLSPTKTSSSLATETRHTSLQPGSFEGNRDSSILPSEYDSYWADGDQASPETRPSQDVERSVPRPLASAAVVTATPAHVEEPPKPSLLNRFSWEANNPQQPMSESQAYGGPVVSPIKSVSQDSDSTPAVERVVEEERQQWSEGPPDSYFGPGHTFTVTKPDPVTDSDLGHKSPTTPLDYTREHTRSPGLHVVNTELDPEAVDLPPRFSAEYSQAPRFSPEDTISPLVSPLVSPQIFADTAPPPAAIATNEVFKPSFEQESTTKSPTTDNKPLGAREIATINSTSERIATYNKTRDHWATADHGLENWLTSTLEANPNLMTQTSPVQRPPTGTVRHKHAGSLALLGKLGASGSQQHHGEPSIEQHSSVGDQVPGSATSPTHTGSPGPGFGGRVASQQMQAKGKDLLHTAGVLSGKGMTSAKGLFAKGKSRFGRDKASSLTRTDSAPSSREASEEPEMITGRSRSSTAMTMTPEKHLNRFSTDIESSTEAKRKRRFSLSSAFNRSSRSRSRPNSIVLPSNTASVFGNTPRNTPPRELSRVLGDQSRPHSYHAPDSWNFAPGAQPFFESARTTTPPRGELQPQGRLGILPSPAKSAFSSQDRDMEQDIPPVPPIPDDLAQTHHRRTSQDDASHRMLQSVIRHSTPPLKDARETRGSSQIPLFALGDAQAGARKRTTETSNTQLAPAGALQSSSQLSTTTLEDSSRFQLQLGPVDWTQQQLKPALVHDGLLPAAPGLGTRNVDSVDDNWPLQLNPNALSVQGSLLDADGLSGSSRDGRSPHLSDDALPATAGAADEAPAIEHNDDDQPPVLNQDPPISTGSRDQARSHPRDKERDDQNREPVSFASSHILSRKRADYDTDDDQPPQLHHETIPAVTEARHIPPVLGLEGASYSDVSEDEEANDDPHPHVRTQSVEQPTGSSGSLLPPVRLPTSDAYEDDYSLDTRTNKGAERKTGHETRGVGTGSLTPVVAHEEEPASSLDKASATPSDYRASRDSLNMPGLDSNLNNWKEKRPLFETELIGAGDVSPVSIASYKVPDENATPKANAGVGSNASWYAKSALHIPKTRVQSPGDFPPGSTDSPEVVPPPQQEAACARQIGEIARLASQPRTTRDGSLSSDGQRPPLLPPADADMDHQTHHVAATPLQVVHAVQEYAASNSSLASWDHDSVAANPRSERSHPDEMKDESDLATPVAQPRTAPQQGVDKAENSHRDNSNMASSNGYFRGYPTSSAPVQQSQQLHASNTNATAPERSKSLLSQISAMVSENGAPISPASSNAGRSTPSTIHRMQFDSPKKTPLNPAQIPEESTTAWNDQTPTTKHDDFDLYADHNGLVKDVRDDSGRPLRVGDTLGSTSAQRSQPSNFEAHATGPSQEARDEERRRYSFERPMSFISGPPDQDGKPQDQINQFAPPSNAPVPRIPDQHRKQLQQPQQFQQPQLPQAPVGTVYSTPLPTIAMPRSNHVEVPRQSPPQLPSSTKPAPARDVVEATRSISEQVPTRITDTSAPPHESTVQQTQSERPIVNGQLPQGGQILQDGQLPRNGPSAYQTPQDSGMYAPVSGQSFPQPRPNAGQLKSQDPQTYRPAPGQPLSHGSSVVDYAGPQDPRMYRPISGQPGQQGPPGVGQMVMPDHDPRAQGQSPGPRNPYEYHQQMMQVQANYTRFPNAGSQPPAVSAQQPSVQTQRPQEKSSSKARLSSVLKGFGGKSSPSSQQQNNTPNTAINSGLKPLPADPTRNSSSHSAVSSLAQSREVPTGRPVEQFGQFAPSNRPPSMGAESHFSHASSTKAQPTDSRLDLRKPATPTPFQAIPPQQLHSNVAPKPSGQHHRESTSGLPEVSKKKRFSTTLGSLFSRKDEKKAQKVQRHSTAPQVHALTPQRPPQQPQYGAQQTGAAYHPGQGPPRLASSVQPQPINSLYTSPQTMSPMSPQSVQNHPPQRIIQQYQQLVQAPPQQPTISGSRPDIEPELNSAYLRTRQLAEEHQSQRNGAQPPHPNTPNPRPDTHASSGSFEQHPPHARQPSGGAPPGGYYKPEANQSTADHGAYTTSLASRQQADLQRQQALLREQIAFEAAQLECLQADQQSRQQTKPEQSVYNEEPRHDRQQMQSQQPRRQQSSYEQGAYGPSHKVHQQMQHQQPMPEQQRHGLTPEQLAYQASLARLHQQQQQSVSRTDGYGISQTSQPQSQQQSQQFIPQHQPSNAQPPISQRSVSGPPPGPQSSQQPQQSQHQLNSPQPLVTQRNASGPAFHQVPHASVPPLREQDTSPLAEPQYEAPPIPAAYAHVSGAFISPRDQQQQPLFLPQNSTPHPPIQFSHQFSDPQMPSISPQVSAQSLPPNNRTHSDASTISIISPVVASPDISTTSPLPNQRSQKPRMSSISEVRQQERPWHLNFPEGATEQEIVRARQRQYMEGKFTTQQQLHAERATRSPSPNSPPLDQSPTVQAAPALQSQVQGGGFKELLPRSSPQPYSIPQSGQSVGQEHAHVSGSHPAQPTSIRTEQAPHPSAYPLPMSPESANITSPVNPVASVLPPPPPPKVPHSSMQPPFHVSESPPIGEQQRSSARHQQYERNLPNEQHYLPPPDNESSYEQTGTAPPSYDGPGIPNDGMDKSQPNVPQPSIITTDADARDDDRQHESRQRQTSIGILQHPQPASMAASPQRTSADMGAESLRRQLLEQEEVARKERVKLAHNQQAESEREKQDRDAARARARELERSASGGGQVGSLRSVGGSRNGGTPGWERRGSTSRPVFELPAVEDDEPSMRATSYPGQEWVPVWTDD